MQTDNKIVQMVRPKFMLMILLMCCVIKKIITHNNDNISRPSDPLRNAATHCHKSEISTAPTWLVGYSHFLANKITEVGQLATFVETHPGVV